MLRNVGRCICEIKSKIAMAKTAFNKKRALFTSTLDLKLRKKLVKCYIWSIALYGAEIWTLRAVVQKHLESYEMWCWRRMEKISWTDHVRNEEVLQRVQEKRNCRRTITRRKHNWIDHVLCRNCLQNHFVEEKIEGRIEVTERQGKRRKQLLDDFKVTTRYCKLKEEARNWIVWRTRFGEGVWTWRKAYSVMNRMNEWNNIKCGTFSNKDISNDLHSSCFQSDIQICVWLNP